MPLTMTFVNTRQLSYGWQKPFTATSGFNDRWWTGDGPGPVAFATFADDGIEVARAQVALASPKGEAYPTWNRPQGGVTEVDLLEVNDIARGRGYGTQAVRLLVAKYDAPIIALARDEEAETFWRRQVGWVEHPRETDPADGPEAPKGMPLFLFDGSGGTRG